MFLASTVTVTATSNTATWLSVVAAACSAAAAMTLAIFAVLSWRAAKGLVEETHEYVEASKGLLDATREYARETKQYVQATEKMIAGTNHPTIGLDLDKIRQRNKADHMEVNLVLINLGDAPAMRVYCYLDIYDTDRALLGQSFRPVRHIAFIPRGEKVLEEIFLEGAFKKTIEYMNDMRDKDQRPVAYVEITALYQNHLGDSFISTLHTVLYGVTLRKADGTVTIETLEPVSSTTETTFKYGSIEKAEYDNILAPLMVPRKSDNNA